MKNSSLSDAENQLLKEFCDFVDAEPMTPSIEIESKIMQKLEDELCPSQRFVFIKFFFIEAFAGVATLLVCPQFGLGLGDHNQFFHTLHETLDPFVFYITCGLFFVIFGAAVSGLLLNYGEIRSIKRSKYIYYLIYALIACFLFFILGAEILLFSSFAWILGSIIGNSFGFELVSRMRFALFIHQ